MPAEEPILSVSGLQIIFAGVNPFTAVNNVSFNIEMGKTLAIVGESGSGKSLTALAIMGLLPKTASLKGDLVLRNNTENLQLTTSNLQQIRGKEIGMVFQEPMSSLNPVMSIGRQLSESILVHQKISREVAKQLAIDWLNKVQLPDPAKIYSRYPHQLSGGQKQRVMIAMAMCNHPSLLIADEPTTALDTTVQQEIIQLMNYLQQKHHSAMIFITHDLALAATIADEVLVMYKGEFIEYGNTVQVLQHPQHGYTKALLACKPTPGNKGKRLPIVADFLNINETTEVASHKKASLNEPIANNAPLLEVKELHIWFPDHKNLFGKPQHYLKAVDDVSFALNKGEILGLVGESGCGKSTLARSLIGLMPAHSGAILFNGEDLTKITIRKWSSVHSKIQMIF